MSKNKFVKPEDTYLSDDDGIPHIDYFPSKAYELYRKSAVGEALMATISELMDKKFITESIGYDVLRQFDYSIIKAIHQSSSQNVVIQANKISGFRYYPKSGQMAMVLDNVQFQRLFSPADMVVYRNQESFRVSSKVTTSTKTEKKIRKKRKKAHESFVDTSSSEEADSNPVQKYDKITSLAKGSEAAYAFQLNTKPLRRVLLMAYSALPEHFNRANPKYYKDQEEYIPCQVPITNNHICAVSYRHRPHQSLNRQGAIKEQPQSHRHDEEDESASKYDPRCEAQALTRPITTRESFREV